MKSCLVAVSLWLCLPCWAQSSSPTEVSRAPPPTASQLPQRGGEPQVKRVVSEDDSTRIDELRVRGITRRVVVQPKLPGAPAY